MTEISNRHQVRHLNKRASINIQNDIDGLTEWTNQNDLNSTTISNTTKVDKIPFIFDDISWQFNWITFFHQLLVHIIPFGFLAVNYSAQGFIPNNMQYLILQVLSVFFVYFLVIAYAMCRDDEQSVIAQGCYLPVVLFFLHKTTVALKYACLSPTETKRVNSEKNKAVSDNYQLQMQLITGWLLQRSDVLQFELGAAAVRVGAKINEMNFTVPNPKSSSFTRKQFLVWNNLLRCDCENASAAPSTVLAPHGSMDDDTESKSPASMELEVQVVEQLQLQQDGSYTVSVFDTVMAIIKLAARDRFADITFSGHIWLSKVVVFLFISVPFLEMIYARNPVSFYSGWFYVYLIFSSYINYMYGHIYCTLLYAVVFDVKRQETMHTLLRAMVRLTDLDPESRKILGEEETDAVGRLARDNVGALFSISRDMKNTLIVKGIDPLPHHADSPTMDDSKDALVPQLCITRPQNVLCWVYARLVLQNFGLRFRHRMDLVAADAIVLHALVVGVQFVMVLLNSNTQTVALSCGFIQMLLSINVSLICVIALFNAGAAVNDAYAQHKKALTTQSLRLRNHAASLRHLRAATELEIALQEGDQNKDDDKIASISEEITKLEQATQLLDSCQSMLAVSNSQGAFKVMGVTAESSISQYLISTALSFFVTYFAVALPGFRTFLFTSQSA